MSEMSWLHWNAEEWATDVLTGEPQGIVPPKLKRFHEMLIGMFKACRFAGWLDAQENEYICEKMEKRNARRRELRKEKRDGGTA